PGEVLRHKRDEYDLCRICRLERERTQIEPGLRAHHRMRHNKQKREQRNAERVPAQDDRRTTNESHINTRADKIDEYSCRYPDKLTGSKRTPAPERMH